MNNLFLIIFCISFIGIPVFILWALINLIRRKPAKKRFVSAGISALVLIISTIGFGLTMDATILSDSNSVTDEAPDTIAESSTLQPTVTPMTQPSPEPTAMPTVQPTQEPTATPEDAPSSSEADAATLDEAEPEIEDPLGFNVMFSDTYRNDVTGNWRLARIAENINIEEYAVEYYNNYFKSDSEIHIVINFTLNTTTRISVMGNLLDVSIMEYVDKEEHDAKLACSGKLLNEYHVDIETGEIEKIQ